MVLISHTNIIVDDFSYGRSESSNKYIYILTHMHSDHFNGLTPVWNRGKIICTKPTKTLLKIRFPQLQNILTLPLNLPTALKLNPSGSKTVEITFFDSNHTPGSVMVLFRGYMGTILHTGDFRFSPLMLRNPILYPVGPSSSTSALGKGVRPSIHVDELVYDNTYCDPIFKFPSREYCFKVIVKIIRENMPCRVFLTIYNLGKEELLLGLAEVFKTLIVVDCDRYQEIKALGLKSQLFTTNKDEGWIHLQRRFQQRPKVEGEKEITINPTGWGNVKDYIMPKENIYIVSYSLHSNFPEIEMFVKSICPSILKPLIINKISTEKNKGLVAAAGYISSLINMKQRGTDILEKQYSRPGELSQDYSQWLDPEKKKALNKELGLVREFNESEEHSTNEAEFKKANPSIFKPKTAQQKNFRGVKFMPIEKNETLSTDDFLLVKRLKEIESDPNLKVPNVWTQTKKNLEFYSHEASREHSNTFENDFQIERSVFHSGILQRANQEREKRNLEMSLNEREAAEAEGNFIPFIMPTQEDDESNRVALEEMNRQIELSNRDFMASETQGMFYNGNKWRNAELTSLPLDEEEGDFSIDNKQNGIQNGEKNKFKPIDSDFHEDFVKKSGFFDKKKSKKEVKKNTQIVQVILDDDIMGPMAKRPQIQELIELDRPEKFKKHKENQAISMDLFFKSFFSESS